MSKFEKNLEQIKKDISIIGEAFKQVILEDVKEWPEEKFEKAIMPEKHSRGNNDKTTN